MLNDSPIEIPAGKPQRTPLEVQGSSPHFPPHPETPTLEKSAQPSSLMPLHTRGTPDNVPRSKKRVWCANELAILFFCLWMLSHAFAFTCHLEKDEHGENFFNDPDSSYTLKVFQGISIAIMAFALLCFTALLITTRLIFPNGKVASYLAKEQKSIIGV